MGWVVVGTTIFGAPRFLAKTLKNTAFFHENMQNRGTPKTAVLTTTHPIAQLTPSYMCDEKPDKTLCMKICKGMLAKPVFDSNLSAHQHGTVTPRWKVLSQHPFEIGSQDHTT